jgi:predicted DNA-binding protein with PD1-like motif
MKIIFSDKETHILNFERGEEVISGLAGFCKEKDIRAGHITGLGAASQLVLAYYNLETKAYEKKDLVENVEILSLIGNVGVRENDELVVHMHGTFGRRDLSVFGGHIFEMVISGAGEVHVTSLPGKISRAYDEGTGLTLMCP